MSDTTVRASARILSATIVEREEQGIRVESGFLYERPIADKTVDLLTSYRALLGVASTLEVATKHVEREIAVVREMLGRRP
jgi:hypothetical protein